MIARRLALGCVVSFCALVGVMVLGSAPVWALDTNAFVTAVLPDIATTAPLIEAQTADGITHTTVTLHAEINLNQADTTYHFEYGTSTGYGASVPIPDGAIAPGVGSSVAVSQQVTGLQMGVTYHYRVVAQNAGGVSEGQDDTFTTVPPAVIEVPLSENVSATAATLSAQINPSGENTTYHFEYGTTAEYGASVPVPDADIGAGETSVPVSEAIAGLRASTLYHFRVVATNALGTSASADQTFTTAPAACPNAAARRGPSESLPDCRAYEQLTPVDKGDSQDLFPSEPITANKGGTPEHAYVAEDGERVLLDTAGSFAGGDAYESTYVFSRGADGWTTSAISPGAGVLAVASSVFDPADLSMVGITDQQFNHLPGEPEERDVANIYGPLGGPYTTIDTLPGKKDSENTMVGASADLSHIVVESRDHELAPGDAGQDESSTAVYEWFDGRLQLVNVNNEGSLLSPCGAGLGMAVTPEGYGVSESGGTYRAVSSDGSRIVFTAPDPNTRNEAGCWNRPTEGRPQENPPQVYMRIDGAKTVEVSEPDRGVVDPDGPQPALYVGASADGSKVFFMSSGELTPGDTTHATELYEYDSEAPEGERLTRVSGGESGDAEGNVDFVGAVSSDGSTVYFTAFGKLAEGATALSERLNENAGGSVEHGGGVNLYRYDTVTGETTFIARINANDYPLLGGEDANYWYFRYKGLSHGEERGALEAALISNANWYTTADGQYLVFGSDVPLTGFDNTHASSVAKCPTLYAAEDNRPRCVELFRYDAADNGIVCVSCASGQPVDNAEFARDPLEGPDMVPPRPVSEDGSDVFFDTFNALVAGTTDRTLHVYEWHEGTLSLISSPDDPGDAYFLGASANGSNVLFGTHAQLVAQDTDANGDLYDARVDGGFVGVTPAQCTGTGCQGVPGAPPVFATPASVTFAGVGNYPAGSGAAVKPKTKQAKTKTKVSGGARRLAQALRACRRERPGRRRTRCEASARARYAVVRGSTKSSGRGK